MDYYYWMVQHPTDQHTHLQVQEIHSCMLLEFFFLSHPRAFSAHDFVKLPPFRNSYPGSHGTHSSPFPTTVLACVVLVTKKKRFRIRSPSLASLCVELACIHATYQHNTQHAGCEALSAVSSHTDVFVSGFDLDPNEHIRFLLIIYLLWCTYNTCHIVSISCDISHVFGIEISRT